MGVDLKKITTGRVSRPARVLLYSADGLGKTTFASGAPKPFFIDPNGGSLRLEVARVVPETWEEFRGWLSAVEEKKVECETLVIDSLTDLEPMSHLHLFPGSTVDKHDGGYGRGETVAVMAWREVLAQLERIWQSGIGIVTVAHAMVKKFDDPSGPGYERFEVACRPKLAGLVRQWHDFVLFGREDVAGQKIDGKNRGVTTGARYIYTKRTPAYDAKARGTSMFPERLPLSWAEFAEAVKQDDARSVNLNAEIDSMLTEIGDAAFATKVKEYVKGKPAMIVDARNRVAARLEEKRSKAEGSAGAT